MALLLSCRSIGKSYGTRTLFSGISLAVAEGERVGLIGANGSGKSTILKILAGAEKADEGELISKRGLRLGYVAQEDEFPEGATVHQVLVGALDDRPMEEHQRVAAASILAGKIGFPDFDQPATELSGGWRKRLAIARELMREPELLLLDEPTNHLDMEGILWLEKLLGSGTMGFVLVSHDRWFLEKTVNRMIELGRAYPDGYFNASGTYSDFLEKRQDFLQAQVSQQAALESRVRNEVEWLQRGPKARRTKAVSRIEAAGQMMADLAELKARNTAGRVAAIDFTSSDRKTRKLLAASGIAKSQAGRILFKDLDLILSPGTKLGLLGPNGSGKTTLLRMLAGQTTADGGSLRQADGLRIVFFQQDRGKLNQEMTLRQALSPKGDTVVYQDKPMHVTSWAKRFLFRTEQLDLAVSGLSGGEQARLQIAQLMLRPADLLLLDEPTNDLDIPTLEVLEESLEEFAGALVLVTHDRLMLDRLCSEILGLDGRGGAHLYADYTQWERGQNAPPPAAETKKATPKPSAAPASKPPSKKLTYMEQREWEQMEGKILEAEMELEERRKEMEDPAVLADRTRLTACCQKTHEAEERVQTLYTRWAELEAKQAGA